MYGQPDSAKTPSSPIQGTEIPRLGFGTWQITGQDATDGVRDALEIGYRHIDTARAYENEAEVGDGHRGVAASTAATSG